MIANRGRRRELHTCVNTDRGGRGVSWRMDKRETERAALYANRPVYPRRVKKRALVWRAKKLGWYDNGLVNCRVSVDESRSILRKKQFRCFHGQISFRRGENLFPISAILESELSNFTLIILKDIYYIYITVLSLWWIIRDDRKGKRIYTFFFFPKFIKCNKCIRSLYFSSHFKNRSFTWKVRHDTAS